MHFLWFNPFFSSAVKKKGEQWGTMAVISQLVSYKDFTSPVQGDVLPVLCLGRCESLPILHVQLMLAAVNMHA